MIHKVRELLEERLFTVNLAWSAIWGLVSGVVTQASDPGGIHPIPILGMVTVVAGSAHVFLRLGRRFGDSNRLTALAWILPPMSVVLPFT